MAMNNTSGSALLGVENSSGGTLATGTSAYATVLRNYTNTDLQIATNNIVRTTITSGGNVLIGTATDAGFKLNVAGNAYINNGVNTGLSIDTTVLDLNTRDGIYLFEDDGQASGRQAISWYNGNQSYYKARLWTEVGPGYGGTTFGIDVADNARNVATRLAIRNGNVGIATTNPSYLFTVGAAGITQDSVIQIASTTSGTGSLYFGDTTGTFFGSSMGGFQYSHFNDLMVVLTAGGERMRILSSGNVLIGTTTDVSGAKLNVNGAIRTGTLDTGYVPGNWKLGRAILGTQPTETYQIIVEINGVLYAIGAANI
jgi:hypothetical protein